MGIKKNYVFLFGFFFVWACGGGRSLWDGSGKKGLPVCNSDSDCVLVSKDCCGCNAGGESIAIHQSLEKDYSDRLKKTCSVKQICFAWYRCDDFRAYCQSQKCSVLNRLSGDF